MGLARPKVPTNLPSYKKGMAMDCNQFSKAFLPSYTAHMLTLPPPSNPAGDWPLNRGPVLQVMEEGHLLLYRIHRTVTCELSGPRNVGF